MGDALFEGESGEKAIFGMGCFYKPDCVFGCVAGVIRTKVGYCGGTGKNPTFKKIGDFLETVEVEYDSNKISYEDLLNIFWRNHSATSYDKPQNRSAIFYNSPQHMKMAEESIANHKREINPHIITQLLPATEFFPAEDYHQKHSLQQYPEIIGGLKIPQNRLSSSHVACRLNGYVAGYGTMENFELELGELGLPEEVEKLVRDLIENHKFTGGAICAPAATAT